MKSIKSMTQAELAAYVQTFLRDKGIFVVLSGGAVVGILVMGCMSPKILTWSMLILQAINALKKQCKNCDFIEWETTGSTLNILKLTKLWNFHPGYYPWVMQKLRNWLR